PLHWGELYRWPNSIPAIPALGGGRAPAIRQSRQQLREGSFERFWAARVSVHPHQGTGKGFVVSWRRSGVRESRSGQRQLPNDRICDGWLRGSGIPPPVQAFGRRGHRALRHFVERKANGINQHRLGFRAEYRLEFLRVLMKRRFL